MLHKVHFLLIASIILLAVSCSGSPDRTAPEQPVQLEGPLDIATILSGDKEGSVSRPVVVPGGNQTITLTGLESGRLYTIYAGESVSSKAVAAEAGNIEINNLGDGVYTFILPEDVTELEFKASEIGLSGGGEFRLGIVNAPEITFQDGARGMTIGQKKEEPVYVTEDGSEVYEAFYSIDVSTLEDPSRIVITEVLSHSGGGGGSHWFCFVDESGKEIETINARALVDLSAYETVYLYNYMRVDYSDGGDMTDSLYMISPTMLDIGEAFTLRNPSTYILGPSSSSVYLVVDRPSDRSLGVFINDLNARIAETGERFKHVLPVEATAEHLIVSIPAQSEEIMFDYDGETLSAELVPSDGSIVINEMSGGTRTFTVPAGMTIFPVVFTGSTPGCTLSMTTDIPDGFLKYTLVNRDGDGYGQGGISTGGWVSAGSGRVFDWFFFRTYAAEGGTFTLTVE